MNSRASNTIAIALFVLGTLFVFGTVVSTTLGGDPHTDSGSSKKLNRSSSKEPAKGPTITTSDGEPIAPPQDAPPAWFDKMMDEAIVTPSPSSEAPVVSSLRRGGPSGIWVAQGPGPTQNGQVENVTPNDEVVGAIHAVVAHPTDPDILYVGGVNGGIWKTTNATAPSPNWTPLIDDRPTLSISELEFDPTDGTRQTLIAGVGRYSSFGSAGGSLTGLLRTTDGGANWTELDDPLLQGENISGVAARGTTIVATSNFFFSAGGLFRSTDTGSSWGLISGTNGLPSGSIHDLAEDPANSQVLYVAVRSVGIFRSTDTGLNWTDISSGDATLTSLIQTSPFGTNNNTELSVGSTGRLVAAVLLNGRARYIGYSDNPQSVTPTWTQMDLPLTPEGSAVALTGATNATPIVITSTGHGLSTRNSVSISGVTGNTAANGVFFVTRIDDDRFSLDQSSGNGNYTGGGTWTRVVGLNPREKAGGQGAIHFSILIDPSDSTALYVGGDRQNFPSFIGANDFSGRLFRGDTTVAPTGGVPSPQWEHMTHLDSIPSIPGGGTASSSAPHADSRDLAVDANGNLIEVDDGGIYRRTSPLDNTGDWFSIIGDLQTTEFHDIAYDGNADIILGGAQDTGTPQQITIGGTTWDSVSTADGGDVAVDVLSLPGMSIRYSSFQFLGAFRRRTYDSANNLISQVFPSLTVVGGGASFSGQFVTPVAVNAIDGTRLAIGGSNSVYESFDRGDSILEVGPGIGTSSIRYGGTSGGVDNEEFLVVGSGSNVYFRTAGGGNLQASPTYPGGSVRDLIVDPDDWRIVFAIDSNQVFRTNNAGTTWTEVTNNLSGITTDFRALEFLPGSLEDAVVVGARDGVFTATGPGFGNWVELGTDLANAPVYDLDYDAGDDVLVAGTLGRGAWIFRTLPELQGVDPTEGPLRGGTLVTLTGERFSPTAIVRFGTDQAAVQSRTGTTEIVVLSPAGTVEGASVDVSIDQPGGSSVLSSSYTFTPNDPALEFIGGQSRIGSTLNFEAFGEALESCALLADTQLGGCVRGGVPLELACTPAFRVVYNSFGGFGGTDAPLSATGQRVIPLSIPNDVNLTFRTFHVQGVIRDSSGGPATIIPTQRFTFTVFP